MRTVAALMMGLGLGLGGCATTLPTPPAEAIRYHLGQPIQRGTVRVEPLTPATEPASLEYRAYLAAVEQELVRNGYTLAQPGVMPDFVAVVAFRRGTELGPSRPSPFSIGLGAGGFSGGRRSGVGLGGGVGIPIGGGRRTEVVNSELSVTIKRRADQSPVWEGQSRAAADVRSRDADTQALAARLARALFTGFPGESGRTIEVK